MQPRMDVINAWIKVPAAGRGRDGWRQVMFVREGTLVDVVLSLKYSKIVNM